MRKLLVAALALSLALSAGCGRKESGEAGKPARIRVGVVAKSLGNGFFDAVNRGAQEAAAPLDAEVIFVGPTSPTHAWASRAIGRTSIVVHSWIRRY